MPTELQISRSRFAKKQFCQHCIFFEPVRTFEHIAVIFNRFSVATKRRRIKKRTIRFQTKIPKCMWMGWKQYEKLGENILLRFCANKNGDFWKDIRHFIWLAAKGSNFRRRLKSWPWLTVTESLTCLSRYMSRYMTPQTLDKVSGRLMERWFVKFYMKS